MVPSILVSLKLFPEETPKFQKIGNEIVEQVTISRLYSDSSVLFLATTLFHTKKEVPFTRWM